MIALSAGVTGCPAASTAGDASITCVLASVAFVGVVVTAADDAVLLINVQGTDPAFAFVLTFFIGFALFPMINAKKCAEGTKKPNPTSPLRFEGTKQHTYTKLNCYGPGPPLYPVTDGGGIFR